MEKHIAIVLAGGKGSRMGSEIPKQYLPMLDKEVLYFSLKCFDDSFVDAIILVCGEGQEKLCRKKVEDWGIKKVVSIVRGGAERYDSVYCGLTAAKELVGEEDTYVYIHDGARPCIDGELLENCRQCVKEHGACVVAVNVKDTIKIVDENGFFIQTPNRDTLMAVQTPQCFEFGAIIEAYDRMYEAMLNNSCNLSVTDDAMVMENFGRLRVKMCKGSYLNIKITTPEDMQTAENIIRTRNPERHV